MKPIFHIGYPKAMSSWLQKYFFVDSCGFDPIMNTLECQINLINPAPFNFDPKETKLRLEERLVASKTLIPVISAESLAGNMYTGGHDGKQLADRLKLISSGNAKILILFREQRSFIRSIYKSWINWGMPYSIEEILSNKQSPISPRFRLEYLEYDKSITYYQDIFGAENVLALPYELFLKEPFNTLRLIHRFSGCAPEKLKCIDKLPVLAKVNRGQSLAWLYWIRIQNRYVYKSLFNYAGIISLDDKRQFSRIAKNKKNPLPKFTDSWFEESFSKTVQRTIGDHYRQSNGITSDLIGVNLKELGYDVN